MAVEFFGRGKLLLGGEYLVLDGAEALAVGVNTGQRLTVEDGDPESGGLLLWESVERDGKKWFSAQFDAEGNVLESSDEKVAGVLSELLKTCRKYNPGFSYARKKARIRSDFDRSWGLGSSSTLIYVLARWADIDPFILVREVMPGSGYDVACAGLEKNNAILYRLEDGAPLWEEFKFDPPFAGELFFVYSGMKQDTREAVRRYREVTPQVRRQAVGKVSGIVREMLFCQELKDFETLAQNHEDLVGGLLGLHPVGREKFADYRGGIVKSLGAWGGDFLLATGKEAPGYFRKKGFETVFPFNEMIAK